VEDKMTYTAMQWQTVNIANAGTLSSAVDLGRIYDMIQLDIPAMNVCSLSITVSKIPGGTYNTLGASSPVVPVNVGSFQEVFKIGGHQFLKIQCDNAQAANRTFYYRGIAI